MAMDQTVLNGDRELDTNSLKDNKRSSARIIAITSGKGGVGKTSVSTNLGIALSGLDKKVCIFDADMGLANINILIGKNPQYTIEDMLSGEKEISEVLMDGPGGIKVVPASSGLEKIVELGPQKKELLVSALEEIERQFDYILIDTSAGISPTVISFVESAQDAVIVVSPEPTSLTDAYILIKVLKGKGFKGNIYILVNMVLSYEDSVKIFHKFNAATKKFLAVEMKYLGHVIMDQGLIASVIQQKPIMLLNPNSISSRCFVSIARKFESTFTADTAARFSEYWKLITPNRIEKEVDNKGIVTPPEEIKEKFSRIAMTSSEEFTEKISQMIDIGTCPEDEARELIQKIEYSFIKKFDKLPYDIKTALYSFLELLNFSDAKIRELSRFLESIYEKRFKQPLHNINDIFIKLLEESEVSEEKMKNLLQLVENSFRRRFKKPTYNLKEILMGELGKDDFFEGGFTDLIEIIKEIYRNRFSVPYEEPLQFPVAELGKIFNKIKEQEQAYDEILKKASNLSREREDNQDQLTKIMTEFYGRKEQK